MKLHGMFEILACHMFQGTNLNNACVVDQNIGLAKAIDDLTESGFNLCAIEQVALNGQDRATARSEIDLCACKFFRVACNERSAPSLGANMPCEHQPESTRTSCDDGNFVAQCVARSSNGAGGSPRTEQKRTCGKQNANVHFGSLQSSTQRSAARHEE